MSPCMEYLGGESDLERDAAEGCRAQHAARRGASLERGVESLDVGGHVGARGLP